LLKPSTLHIVHCLNCSYLIWRVNKKSLCVENAEANSERNLNNPPSGLVQAFTSGESIVSNPLEVLLFPGCYT
jgi:hypothetical protein